MDREYLTSLIACETIDFYSVDSLTCGFRTQGGLKREEFCLAEMESISTNPIEGDYNVHCVLIRSESSSERSALIYLHEEGSEVLDRSSWIRGIASGGVVILGIDIPRGDPFGKIVTKVHKGVSYLHLRRDIVDPERIFCWGKGEPGMWGLLTAALDERVSGLIMEKVPLELVLDGRKVLKTAEICELLPPRRLALLGVPDANRAFEGVKEIYKSMGRAEALRFEKGSGEDVKHDVIKWILQGRSK